MRGSNSRTSPRTQTEWRTCTSAGATPQPIKVVTSPQYHNLDTAVELIGRINEADIFLGVIWVTALIDTRAQVCTTPFWLLCRTQVWNTPSKANSEFRGNRGVHHSIPGVYRSYCLNPSIKRLWWMHPNAHPEVLPYSLRVPIQLGTSVLDRDMARITVEELAHACSTWQQTYMSTMVTAKAADTVEMKNKDVLTIDAL